MFLNTISVISSAALVLTSLTFATPASARTVNGMQDLIGARGRSLDDALQRRGYQFATNQRGASLYWNSSRSACISARIGNGRVQSIERATAKDCGKDAGSQLAGILVGAAAAGLVAALSAHHHGQEHKNNNQGYNRQFQRGYNDAMKGAPYSRHDSEAYHAGYMSGEAERNNSSGRPGGGGSGGGSGGRPARISDINGMNAIAAIDEMQSRGFAGVDTISTGNTLYQIFYLRRTRQCVQMTTANNRVVDIRDIERHPKCR